MKFLYVLTVYFAITVLVCVDASICLDNNINNTTNCNGQAECNECDDETNCPEEPDMVPCNSNGGLKCFHPEQRCDGAPDCRNCLDEENCGLEGLFFCENRFGCVSFERNSSNYEHYYCDNRNDCTDGSDEKKFGFGFKCAFLYGPRCIVPQLYLKRFLNYSDLELCENGADKCFEMKGNEKVFDTSTCWTCLEGSIIQRQQVCNGVFDCPDLSDECLCFRDNTNKNTICEQLLNSTCDENEFPCPNENLCVKISKICDGQNDCRNGTDEIYCEEPQTNGGINFICPHFYNPATKCNGIIECSGLEDECNKYCEDEPFYCKMEYSPNWNISYEISLPDSKNQTCVIETTQLCDLTKDCLNGIDESYCPELVRCDRFNKSSKIFINQTVDGDRCNLEAKCENIADELNCSSRTHFYCDNYTKFVPQWLRFDGHPDCDDFTDECAFDGTSVSSTTELVKYEPFKIFLWIFMLLALLGNTVVITKTSMELKYSLRRRSHSSINRVGLCNKIMILNLALSDFLMGIYLFIIVVKSLQFAGIYCKERVRWLQGNECAFAGVLAVISSQASILLMVLMTTYRLYGVANPFRAEKIKGRMICAACFCIWILALFLGIVPLFPGLSLTFASSVNIYQPYGPNLISLSDFSKLFKNASKLPGLENIPPPNNLTIKTFCSLFSNSNSQPTYCEQIDPLSTANLTGYYGTDGVCLPRYFSNPDDPAFVFTFSVLTFNFSTFVYMLVAYLSLYWTTSQELRQSEDCSESMDDVRLKENRALWSKIVRLIVTDFLCWIPICVMSFMSFAGVVLPNFVYPFTALVLVPINSAANPWLYSSFLIDYFGNYWNSSKFKLRYLHKGASRRKERRKRDKVWECFCWVEKRRSSTERSRELLPIGQSSVANNTNDDITLHTDL